MEKRILIEEDFSKFKEIAGDLKQFMPVLNEIKASFEGLEIGAFTNEVLKESFLLGPKKYIEIYLKNLNNQLDKWGAISIIRQNAIAGSEKLTERFKNAVADAKRFQPEIYSANRPKLPLKFISFEDGHFVISREDKEMILENYCRLYLETPEEIMLYEASKKLSEAFNEYLDFFNSTGIPSINKHYAGSHVLKYDEDAKKMVLYPGGIKAVASYKKRKAEFDSERNERNQKRIDAQKV